MKKDDKHIEMRNKAKELLDAALSEKEVAEKLGLTLGSRYERGTVRWYKYCLVAQRNQRKAFEKYGINLYSKAGKIAQKKHPWIGHELGKKYGSAGGKKRMKQLKRQGILRKYFSNMAKKLQEKNPEQSRGNMKKAIAKMKNEGTFIENSTKGAISCMKMYPNQLKEMSKRAHELYPDLAYRSRRKQREGMPYEYDGCKFDSNQEREVCKILIEHNLIDVPREGKNVQFKILNYEIDFFLKERVFLEFHPPIRMGNTIETEESYFNQRRKILDENGFASYPLVVIPHISKAEEIVEGIKEKYLK